MLIVYSVAYLGFQKEGANFCWQLVLTQRGSQTKFSIFFSMSKENFFGQGGMAQCPPKYASVFIYSYFIYSQ